MIRGLSLEDRIALEQRLLAERAHSIGNDDARRELSRLDRRVDLPLSFAQQRLWFLEQLEGEQTAYNMAFAWRLVGKLDAKALSQAFGAIVRRHEPLRTTFAMVDDEPVQVIGLADRFELPIADLSSLNPTQQQTEFERRSRLEVEQPFDLSADLMLRATLLRLDKVEHILLLTVHHIASDGWSLNVLWQELQVLYDAYRRGTARELPELKVQYADFALWQRDQLQGDRLEQLMEYWRTQLDGVKALELRTDHPRPAVTTYGGDCCSFELKRELVARLKALCQAEGVTLQMTLMAAFQTLLSRYSGQVDIAVGTLSAGRDHAELERLVGFFINTLVLRTDLSGDPSFRELLGRVREVSLDAYDHRDLPFEKLVEELQPQRHLNQSPLAQVLFQLLSFPNQPLALAELAVTALPASSRRSRYDLEMQLSERQFNTIAGTVTYKTDLFDHSTIERLVGHFMTLLEGIVADADQPISKLPMVAEAERRKLLLQWNDTAADYPRDQCVHHLFEQQAERNPDSIAVVYEDQELSYQTLNERANQLAHYLRTLGVGPETLVGVCMDRSPELIVSILGILKAGAAYVPLDPTLPTERLRFMLDDSRPRVIVTVGSRFDAATLASSRSAIVRLDDDAHRVAAQSTFNPQVDVDASGPAYVIYTSGSTGTPKGVVGLHRGTVNRLFWMWRTYPFEPHDVCCQKTTLSFVDSVWEIFGPLLHGVTSILIPDAVVKDPQRLVERLAAHHVTRIVLVPSLMAALLDTHPQLDKHLPRLKHWISSGERLTPGLLKQFRTQLPHSRLLNLYGSSEVAADVTCFDTCEAGGGDSIPIGRPIFNTQAYVLDKWQQVMPIGVPGELFIGGDSLARGYLNRPQLTEEKFPPNPFSEKPGSRLYRTGDLCRWRNEGNLEFMGRLDDQVKLRGVRIELGEIETILNEHPDIAQSVVILREDKPGDPRLVGYYVAADGVEVSVSDVIRHLRARLPDAMVPSAFVLLKSLPLTPSGKVQRRELPVPEDSRPQLRSQYVAPRDALEELLAEIWSAALQVDHVGIHDDFFDSGGHSLLAVRLFSRLEKKTGHKLPLATLFQAPTIARLAEVIRTQSLSDRPQSSAVQIHGATSATPLFVVSPGAVLFLKGLARRLEKIRPVCGLQAPGLNSDDEELLDRVEDIAEFHLREVRRIQPRGPYLLSGRCFGSHVAFEMARRLIAEGEEIGAFIVFDSAAPLAAGVPLPGTQRSSSSQRVGRMTDYLKSGELLDVLYRKVLNRWQRIAARLTDLRIEWFAGPEYRRMHRRERANWKAHHHYRAKPYPGNVTLIRSSEFAAMSRKDFHLKWNDLAVQGLECRQVICAHLDMFEEPAVEQLATVIEQRIAEPKTVNQA